MRRSSETLIDQRSTITSYIVRSHKIATTIRCGKAKAISRIVVTCDRGAPTYGIAYVARPAGDLGRVLYVVCGGEGDAVVQGCDAADVDSVPDSSATKVGARAYLAPEFAGRWGCVEGVIAAWAVD